MSTSDDPKAFFEQLKVDLAKYLLSLDDFEIQKEIGIGGYGRVFLARQKDNNKQVAIKEWIIENLTGRKLLYFCREIQIFSKNDHPFLLPFIGFTATPPYSIITEYMQNGSLHSVLRDNPQSFFSPDQKNMIAMGIAAGMSRLHEQNIIHRDLKSQNVLMDENLLPKVCDFGVSRIMASYENEPVTQKVGTPAWMAPEFFGPSEYSNKVDVYSYALILWELETGKTPFRGLRPPQIMDIVYNRHERPPIPPQTSHSLKKLIQLCWSQKPSDRPSFATIFEWFAIGKVTFLNAKPESAQRIVHILDQWESQQPTESKAPPVVPNIPELFLNKDTANLIEYTKNLNKDNCTEFFDAILEILNSSASSDIIANALFELLKLITSKQDCLDLYIKRRDYLKLPFENRETGSLALSCLIPIFEKHHELATTDLVKQLDTIVPLFSLKVVRLYSILCDFFTDSNVDWTILDSLIMRSETFIEQQAAKPLIHTLYKLVSRIRSVREGRLKYILGIFANCLESQDTEIVLTAYSAIIALQPSAVPISSETLINHLKSSNNSISLSCLQLLSFSWPELPTKELVETILKMAKGSKWASISILNLCKCPQALRVMLSLSSFWLSTESKLEETFQLQIILALLINPQNRNSVSMNDDIPQFFDRIIKTQKIEYIETLCSAIRMIPTTPEFIGKLSASNFINDYFKIMIALNLEQVYMKGYLLFDKLCKFAFIPESLMLLDVSVRHLKECPNLQKFALEFLTVLSNYPSAVEEMKKLRVPQILKQGHFDEEMNENKAVLLNNISNNVAH
ncbi:hypothetical protein M9Y10_045339 [Tritrichomonas musculus]|uniref:Protein kinase domain-containing protein n=1 Tax=Tritrichomonas musculus TaxID=1915356 RepID=A0ABR2JUY7_9EUKA